MSYADSAPAVVAAPGMGILSTWNDGGLNTINGTSMASPRAAGAVALYVASENLNTGLPSDRAAFEKSREALLSAAEDSSPFNNSSGHPHMENFLHAGTF